MQVDPHPIEPGRLIWAWMLIPANALNKPPGKLSTAMQRIFADPPEKVKKLGYILEVFDNSSETEDWYPIEPAEDNGHLHALPSMGYEHPAWIYLGDSIEVLLRDESQIEPKSKKLTTESLKLVIAAMKDSSE